MAAKVKELTETLREACYELVMRLLLDPETQTAGITVRPFQTTRFDNTGEKTCYLIEVVTTDSSMLSGAVNSFKGSYKERLEGALEVIIRSQDPNAEVAVDIVGPPGPSVEKLVPVESLVLSGKISRDSPIASTAREFEIPYILIRGRHLIGPNPALAATLTGLLRDESRPKIALDLFSGTGIATKVILREAPSCTVTAVDLDGRKTGAMSRHIQSKNAQILTTDAFAFHLQDKFDLVVADPYYEDCVAFLDARILEMRAHAKILVLVGGRLEHESWNERILALLSAGGFVVRGNALYGQTVFVCS